MFIKNLPSKSLLHKINNKLRKIFERHLLKSSFPSRTADIQPPILLEIGGSWGTAPSGCF